MFAGRTPRVLQKEPGFNNDRHQQEDAGSACKQIALQNEAVPQITLDLQNLNQRNM